MLSTIARANARKVAPVAPLAALRAYSAQAPEAKAKSIIDALPGSTILSKSGILATGTAASVFAISNSLYVLNAETCLLAVFAAFVGVCTKTAAPGYKQWAESYIDNVKNVLNSARKEHVVAVQDRIDNVNKLGDVVATTKALFAASKETVAAESEAFVLKQKVDLAREAKEVLDSWVRYESQVRAREQLDLVAQVTQKIEKQVSSKQFQDDALKSALEEVERIFKK